MLLKTHAPKGFPLPEYERARLADAVRLHGERAILQTAGLSRNALARALAGLPVYAGTLALIRQCLNRPDPDHGNPMSKATGS